MNKYGIYRNGRPLSQKEAEQVLRDMNATDEELRALKKWLKSGGCFYDNPDNIHCLSGFPMNFIDAMRLVKEIGEEDDTDIFTELQQVEEQFECFESDADELPF